MTKPKVSVIGTATAADCSLCSVSECPYAAPLLFTVLLSKPLGNTVTGRCCPGSENLLTKGNLTTQQVWKSGRSQSYFNKTNDLDICLCSSALSQSSSLVAALSNTKMTKTFMREIRHETDTKSYRSVSQKMAHLLNTQPRCCFPASKAYQVANVLDTNFSNSI